VRITDTVVPYSLSAQTLLFMYGVNNLRPEVPRSPVTSFDTLVEPLQCKVDGVRTVLLNQCACFAIYLGFLHLCRSRSAAIPLHPRRRMPSALPL
jgi:hypothetical protein